MIITKVGDITKIQNVEYICNAANGIGILGSGVAGGLLEKLEEWTFKMKL